MRVPSAAWRMAWREARASAGKFLFVIFGVAVGVGALAGVRGFSAAFHTALNREARTLMAADLTLRQFLPTSPAQEKELESWVARGARLTRITETVTMLSAGAEQPPVLVSVKAVDAAVYPFYGKVRLEPEARLGEALTPERVTVSDDLMVRLDLKPGATVHIGEAAFTVFGTTRLEPDRMTGSLNVGPRVLMSAAAFERTGLATYGARSIYRLLFRLPAQGLDVAQMSASLKKAFPEALLADYRESHPLITRALDRSTTFLSLVSLIALIVGALGVATSIHSHIQQRLDSIAILKCLGARSGQIIRIYTLQTLLLGLAGGLAGLAVGAVVQRLFPLLLARYFQFESIPWSPAFAIEGIVSGALVALLFSLPPLLSIRAIRPALIFRREMGERRRTWRNQLAGLGSAVVIGVSLAGVAAWLARDARMGAWFVAGLVVALLLLAGVAWVLLRALRAAVRRAPVQLPLALRQGMANLYRPGNHAASVLVALGIGVMFTLSIYLIQHSLLGEVVGAAPKGSPNVFLINITSRDQAAIRAFLDGTAGVEGKAQLSPLVPARLLSVDGASQDEQVDEQGRRHRNYTRQVTWAEARPEDVDVRQGSWWAAGAAEPQVSLAEPMAARLKARVGSRLKWTSVGREFEVRVAAIHRSNSMRPGGDAQFYFNQAALAGLPAQWFASLRLPAARVAVFQRDAFRRFPAVTVINLADVMSIIQEVVDQVALVIRFISAFAILAGAIILASTVAGTRLRRTRESAVLKTLGARRRILVSIFSVEFLILGAVAGLMGGGLATLFSRLLLTRFLDAKFSFDALPNVAAVGLTALLAVAAGWVASLRILKARPLEVLRDE